MKRIVLAAACCLSLSLAAAPVWAQTRLSDRQAEQASERQMTVAGATRRTTEILSATQGDPAIAAATNPNTLAAAVQARALVISEGREELSEISRNLLALPPISDAASPDVMQSIDRSAHNASALALKADGILEALQMVPEAVRTGDQARFDAAYRSVIAGAVLLHEAQAMIFRGQSALQEPDAPQGGQFAAMACFADGQAAMQAGMMGLRERNVAVEQIAAARSCMREQVSRGLSTITVYSTSHPVAAELAPLQVRMFDTILEAEGWLGNVGESLSRGESSGAIAATHNPAYTRIITSTQEINALQLQIMADQD